MGAGRGVVFGELLLHYMRVISQCCHTHVNRLLVSCLSTFEQPG